MLLILMNAVLGGDSSLLKLFICSLEGEAGGTGHTAYIQRAHTQQATGIEHGAPHRGIRPCRA